MTRYHLLFPEAFGYPVINFNPTLRRDGMSRETDGNNVLNRLFRCACTLIWLFGASHAGFAAQTEPAAPESDVLQSVRVTPDDDAIDLTKAVKRYGAQGDHIQVSTAPGPDGIVRRIEVSAVQPGAKTAWIAFALTNDTTEQLTRLIWAPHYRLAGSGVVWPDLGSSRIRTITASQGNAPEREDRVESDVFRLTIDPGTTVTYIAELSSPNLPQIYLWEPDAFKDKSANITLYQGIVIGVAGLLALFLTIVFVVRATLIFPAAAALAWAVFAYVCIDFGFWRRIIDFQDQSERIWRAGVEATIAATLIIFLFAYLNLRRWHVRYSHITAVWFLTMAAVVALSVYNAPVAAGVARISIAAVAVIGALLILSLALRGSDRAIMLIPTWFLLLVWVGAAAATVLGALSNDLASPGLLGGLVLIVMLIGFTILQSAFAASGLLNAGGADSERRALAMTGCGDAIFDWNVGADQIYVSGEIESQLGLKHGALQGPASTWLDVLHPLDRDRYAAALDGLLDLRSGRISHDFRLRAADGQFYWFMMKARPVVNADGEVVRVIGALADVTESKSAEERMLHDAVHDNLTGLPNRQLFMDRLETVFIHAKNGALAPPAIMLIDIDRFSEINDSAGLSVGDSTLLTVARRVGRNLRPGDTLARLRGDRFGAIVLGAGNAEEVAAFVESIRAILATPISFGDREVTLTASLGLSLFDPEVHLKASDLLSEAEIALVNAKKAGGDAAVAYNRSMRGQRSDRASLQKDLGRALERGEIKLLYQPVVRLEDRTVAGFEALLRWRHPLHGQIESREFMALAEDAELAADLGEYILDRATRELAAWQKALSVEPPIFVNVPIFSQQMLQHDLLASLKSAMNRYAVQKGSLKLEFSESLVMENPEYSAHLLHRVRELGAGLALGGFGVGHSSLRHLQRYAFDMLRPDASLIAANGAGERPLILRSILSMAHDLGMTVIMEKAESESDAVEFAQMGCEFALGQTFGQPMGAESARNLMGALMA